MYQNFIIPCLYEAQHVSGDTPPIIRSLKLHWQPMVFHNTVEGWWTCSWWTLSGSDTVPDNVHHLRVHQPSTLLWKNRSWQCSFRFLMMGGVSPETCWASYKYGIRKFSYIVASCWIFLYELWLNITTTFYQFSCHRYSPLTAHESV
jgi:hypothetical protein